MTLVGHLLTRATRVPWSRVAAWFTVLTVGGLSFRLALELAKRAAFPWDLLLWSESPFMTDMLKIARGDSPFGPMSDVNSFAYSPGLEYLSYALFAPFGAALDVRFPRALCIVFGVASALLIARLVVRWVTALDGERRRPLLAWTAFCIGLLACFRSPTTVALHPDSFQIAHELGTLSLCSAALYRRDFRLALAAIGLAGLGVWTKQPAALAGMGAGLCLALGHAWGRSRLLALAAVGGAVTLGSLACVLAPEQSRFYLLEVPLRHGVQWGKVIGLLMNDIGGTPHRLLLWLFGAAGFVQLWSRGDASLRRTYLIPWLCMGLFEGLTSMAAYLKPMGIHNNLYAIDLLWLIAALAGFARLDAEAGSEPRPFGVALPAALAVSLLPVFALLPFHGGFVGPNQMPIRDAHYTYGLAYDALVKRDIEAGKRVLVGHGTATWIHNGVHEPPLDRLVSALELHAGGLIERAGTVQRLNERAYDRIYLPASLWFDASMYGPAVTQALATNYREVSEDSLPAVLVGAAVPNEALMVKLVILEPRQDAAPARPLALSDSTVTDRDAQ